MAAPAAFSLSVRRLVSPIWIIAGMALYSVIAYGLVEASDSLLLLTVGATLAKAAAVYVYFGSALLAYGGRFLLLSTGGLAAVAIALLLVPTRGAMTAGMELCMLLAGGGLLGYQLSHGKSGLSAYLVGLTAVLLASLLWLVPQIDQMQSTTLLLGNDSIENMKALGAGFGGEELTPEMLESMQQALAFFVRILPGLLILNFIALFSVAALLFMSYLDHKSAQTPLLAPFSLWQIPFSVMILLPIGVAAWYLGSGWPKLVGENLLLMLSVFYCVTGLSLLAHYLDKIKMSRLGKVAIYILMIPAGTFGFFALGLAGVLDSFFDWRRLYRPDEKLEKTVE